MIHATTPEVFVLSDAGAARSRWSPLAVSGTAVLVITMAASLSLLMARSPAQIVNRPFPASAPAVPPRYSGLLDPGLARTSEPVTLDTSLPLGPNFEAPAPTVTAALTPPDNTEPAAPSPAAARAELEAPAASALSPEEAAAARSEPDAAAVSASVPGDRATPMPLPRPPGLRIETSPFGQRPMARPTERAARTPGTPTAPVDRNFIDKLFGIPQALKSVLSYATPEDGQMGGGRVSLATPPWSADRGTAVYDIAAHTVTLPNGVTLEAHSGLGDRLDDPRHVHEPNRGATPPATYDLELRAQLFHGVQAIRLNPVSGSVFGRTGLLAHTYMLGPKGDSNGCVSFRNYNAFLQAYRNGQVKRLTVVAGR